LSKPTTFRRRPMPRANLPNKPARRKAERVPVISSAQKNKTVWLLTLALFSHSLASNVRAADSAATSKGRTVLILGDSLAAGYGLDPSEAFPSLLQEKIDAEHWPDKVVNAGVSGDTSAGGLRRLDWVLRQKVDVLVLELGGNDGLRGIQPETTQANLQAIID